MICLFSYLVNLVFPMCYNPPETDIPSRLLCGTEISASYMELDNGTFFVCKRELAAAIIDSNFLRVLGVGCMNKLFYHIHYAYFSCGILNFSSYDYFSDTC